MSSTQSLTPQQWDERLRELTQVVEIGPLLFESCSDTSYKPVAGRAVFGGLLIAQAMDAANRTVPKGFQQHEMHGKFLNPGRLRKFHFEVSRLRDGRSYVTRRVDAIQDGILVFTASMSFQRPEPEQPDYFAPPPVVDAANKFELLREVPDGHSNIATHVLPPEMCLSGENRTDYALEHMSKDDKWYPFLKEAKDHQEWLPVEYRVAVPTMFNSMGMYQFGTKVAFWLRSKGPCVGDDNYQRTVLGFHVEYV